MKRALIAGTLALAMFATAPASAHISAKVRVYRHAGHVWIRNVSRHSQRVRCEWSHGGWERQVLSVGEAEQLSFAGMPTHCHTTQVGP